MIDEITAHARAAFELDRATDTIIEIGGQDAKFTTMKNGMVTSAVMNNVCAAGTGSFIEEQAQKLASRWANMPSGRSMFRLLWSVTAAPSLWNAISTIILRQVIRLTKCWPAYCTPFVENYLAKVAVEANIGARICFQGATARNKALVAAFEQRLQKPIFVSKFCHLTGALGAALLLSENRIHNSSFRGIGLHRSAIPVTHEVCHLCHNHCKINKFTVEGEQVAFGLLCGRDYDAKQPESPRKKHYDLLRARQRAFRTSPPSKAARDNVRLGIPSALYLAEEMPLWKKFFETLGVEIMTSENYQNAVKTGRKVAGADFCAPMNALFGHVSYLARRCDYIFLPVYLAKEPINGAYRYYCYYTPIWSFPGCRHQKPAFEGKDDHALD